jgi:hypothetical protein
VKAQGHQHRLQMTPEVLEARRTKRAMGEARFLADYGPQIAANHAYNQAVNTRQVRRLIARREAKQQKRVAVKR